MCTKNFFLWISRKTIRWHFLLPLAEFLNTIWKWIWFRTLLISHAYLLRWVAGRCGSEATPRVMFSLIIVKDANLVLSLGKSLHLIFRFELCFQLYYNFNICHKIWYWQWNENSIKIMDIKNLNLTWKSKFVLVNYFLSISVYIIIGILGPVWQMVYS